MSRFHDKAEGHTKQVIGQMIGDDRLVNEGRQQISAAENEPEPEHSDQGIIKDERSEEQPKDKARAQTVHKTEPQKHVGPDDDEADSRDNAHPRQGSRQ